MTITIRGKDFEGDFLDVDFMERYEVATVAMRDGAAEIQRNGRGSVAAGFRAMIDVVNGFFDSVLGDGASDEIFEGAEGNVKAHYDAVGELVGYADTAKKELNDLANRHAQRNAARAPKLQGQLKPWPPQAKPKHK